jgi:hypothetical protein
MRATILALLAALAWPAESMAWDVYCENALGEDCPDPFARAQTPWRAHPRAEHRALLDETLDISGLPQVLRQPFTLETFARDRTLTGEDGAVYPSVRPVVNDAERRREREVSIPAMANLPDFAYTLWDLAAGNELCPPNPAASADPFDCHNYETHIGWLNSNHMLPQSRLWYEHLHAIALELAADCKRQTEAVPLALRDRYEPYLLACEKQALMVEGVGHHYLQDSWSMGHLWERWGGTEIADFGGDRALGFAVGAFTGLIHGGKAVFDDTFGFKELAPWDDPMCAPHEGVEYLDRGVTPIEKHPGAGDIFVEALRGELPWTINDQFWPQRQALYGCAVDGIREVYAATARLHGPMVAPDSNEFDSSRSVRDDSCWAQRATNRAMAEGCGVHNGEAPDAFRFLPVAGALPGDPDYFQDALQPLLFTQLTIAPLVAGAPILWNPVVLNRFRTDASHACASAIAHAADPAHTYGTDLASGGLPPLAGIRRNADYARGNAAARIPPAFYADPFPPWSLREVENGLAPRKEVLNLFFADANAAERCRDLSPTDLDDYVAAVQSARDEGADDETIEARCGQCIQMIAPHLRHGRLGDHDFRREAFCQLVAPGDTAFIYTEQDPASFTGSEPLTHDSLRQAARALCGCAIDVAIMEASAATVAQSCLANGNDCRIDGPTVKTFDRLFDETSQTHPETPERLAEATQQTTLFGEQGVSILIDSTASISYPQRQFLGASCLQFSGSDCAYSDLIVTFEAEDEFRVTVTGNVSAGGTARARLLFGLVPQVDAGQGAIRVVVAAGLGDGLIDETRVLPAGIYRLQVDAGQTLSGFASGIAGWNIQLTIDD